MSAKDVEDIFQPGGTVLGSGRCRAPRTLIVGYMTVPLWRPVNHLYEILASSLEYPGEDWNARLERCRQWLSIQEPEVAVQFVSFRRKVRKLPIEKLQELYTQTFVLNPVCRLDIGHHLFGENDKRGELSAKLRETEAPYELGQADQLPDHLPVLLRLLTKLEDEKRRHALIVELLIPALGKMLEALSQTDNPYQDLIEVISKALKNEVPDAESSPNVDAGDVPEVYRISSKAPASERPAKSSPG
jgi:nitrate reductase delta subunit